MSKEILNCIKEIQNIYIELNQNYNDFSTLRKNIHKDFVSELKKDILKQTVFTGERVVRYALLQNNNIKNESDLTSLKENINNLEFDSLKSIFDNEIYDYIKKYLQEYANKKKKENKKVNPYHVWTNERILKMAYYFSHFDNERVKNLLTKIAKHFKINLNSNLQIHTSPIYNQQIQDYAWFALFDNKEQKHNKSNQVYFGISEKNIEYGVYNPIDKKDIIERKPLDFENINFDELIIFYKNNLDKYIINKLIDDNSFDYKTIIESLLMDGYKEISYDMIIEKITNTNLRENQIKKQLKRL